ncbi:hypothetical protein Leryth_012757 [Lithospermum erythrorhizon]|nr:hypothetical protein Leryth_012757 [Lithospermum erythrorhizon]
MEDSKKVPLLRNTENDQNNNMNVPKLLGATFSQDEDDMNPITGMSDFLSKFYVESLNLWYLAFPAIFTMMCQFSTGSITQVFAGHVGTLQLASFSIENAVIAGLAYGTMLGMGSAVETLCGQAYGAKQYDVLGVYMQRSWIILFCTSIPMLFLYIFATSILRLIGQSPEIAELAGKFSHWMIPQLFAFALNFPIQKFLQAQSKIFAMAIISFVGMVMHIFFSWLLIVKLGWGLGGGAIVLNASWWFVVIAQLVYIFSGTCGEAWSGFSIKAFQNLWGFVRLSVSSAVMVCLEMWYYSALLLFAGYLKNAEVAVSGFSVCFNILCWVLSLAFGFNAAISVRVSNELGAGHPMKTKFAVIVVTLTTLIFGFLIALVLMATRKQYPAIFVDSKEVQHVVYELTPLLCGNIIINVLQPSLSGVAVGAGWQAYVVYVNIICYYVVGIPLGLILSYVLDMGIMGLFYGMTIGTMVQTFVLIWMMYKTDWNKEILIVEDRMREWGGETVTNAVNGHGIIS